MSSEAFVEAIALQFDRQVKEVVPGKELHIPDILSRAPLSDMAGDSELEEMTQAVHRVVNSLSISPSKLNDFCQGTLIDAHLSAVISYIQNGWPHPKKCFSQEAQHFWDFRQDLTVAEDIVLMSDRVILPSKECPTTLQQLHVAHQGIDKMKHMACTCVYWPGLDRDTESFVMSCQLCLNRSLLKKETLMPHVVGIDIFILNSWDYLSHVVKDANEQLTQRQQKTEVHNQIHSTQRRPLTPGKPIRVRLENG